MASLTASRSATDLTPAGEIASIDDRLDILAHSLSHDVIPGIERELGKIRGWLAIHESRPTDNQDIVKAKLEAQHKYEQLLTSIKVLKTAMGPLYSPGTKTGPFDAPRTDAS